MPGAADIVVAQFDATNQRDWATAMALYDDDVELVVPSQLLNGGTYSSRSMPITVRPPWGRRPVWSN